MNVVSIVGAVRYGGLGRVIELLPAAPQHVAPLAKRGQPWLVEYAGRRVVLRRYPPERYPPASSLPHVRWLHDFLRQLTHTGFRAPQPVDDLAGVSLMVADGAIWELLTYQPGRVLGWCRRESLWQAGDIIARFHAASEQVSDVAQRPGALPLPDGRPATAVIQELVRLFHDQLDTLSYATARRCVIHGDPTSHNVLVGGRPSHAVGLIDFTLAYHEAAVADVAFALWRSGRPSQGAWDYDVGRVTSLVRGYHRVRPLEPGEAALIPILMIGRGLQMLTRRESRGQRDQALLARLAWVSAHQQELHRAVEAALITDR